MAGWTTSFVIASGLSASVATWVLSSHWLGLILSRALFSSRVDNVKEMAIERSAVLSAVVIAVLVVSDSPTIVVIGPLVVGACMALVMPTSLALAGARIQGNPGSLFGALLTVAQVGGMLVPASIGFIAEQTNVRLGLAILIGSYGAIALIVRRLSPDPYRRPAKAG
jgi:fucose permease